MRVVDTLYDTTSTSGGTLTATVETSRYSRLLLVAKAAGAAAPTDSWVVSAVLPDATVTTLGSLTEPGIGASIAQGVGPGCTLAWPVPNTTRVVITAGASSTVRLVILGVIEEGL